MCQARAGGMRNARRRAWERADSAVLPFPRGRSESRLRRRHQVRRCESIWGVALLGAGLLAAIASGGGPESAMTEATVLFSAAGVGLMLAGLALVMHAEAPDKPCGVRRRIPSPQPVRGGEDRI